MNDGTIDDVDDLYDLAGIAFDLGKVERATEHPDGTKETVATHTVMLGLVATHIAVRFFPRYRFDRITAFALVHDVLEAQTGDVDTFDASDATFEQKCRAEVAALHRLEVDGPTWLVRLLGEYERQQQPEARLVRFVDKILPKLTHAANNARTLRAKGYSRGDFLRITEEQFDKLYREYPELTALKPLVDTVRNDVLDAWGLWAAGR